MKTSLHSRVVNPFTKSVTSSLNGAKGIREFQNLAHNRLSISATHNTKSVLGHQTKFLEPSRRFLHTSPDLERRPYIQRPKQERKHGGRQSDSRSESESGNYSNDRTNTNTHEYANFNFFYTHHLITDTSMKLCLATVGLCFAGIFIHNNFSTPFVVKNFYSHPNDIQNGRPWTLFTHWMFHANIPHFFFNCLFLVPTIPMIADILGNFGFRRNTSGQVIPAKRIQRRYIAFMLTSAFAAITYQQYHDDRLRNYLYSNRLSQPTPESFALPAIGASGVAMSFVGFVLAFTAPRIMYDFPLSKRPVGEAYQARAVGTRDLLSSPITTSTSNGSANSTIKSVKIRSWTVLAVMLVYFYSLVRKNDSKEIAAAKARARSGKPAKGYKMDLTQHACHLGGLLFGSCVGFALAFITRKGVGVTRYHEAIEWAFRPRFQRNR